MKTTKSSDLAIGGYYVMNDKGDSRYCIFKVLSYIPGDPERVNGYYISNISGTFEFRQSTPWFSGRKVRIATWEEINWLDRCISVNKLVPREPVITDYLIYN